MLVPTIFMKTLHFLFHQKIIYLSDAFYWATQEQPGTTSCL